MTQPAAHHVTATIRTDGLAQVVLDGVPQVMQCASLLEARQRVVGLVRDRLVTPTGRSVSIDVDDPQGATRVIVNPDGSVTESPVPVPSASEDTIPPGQLPALREEAAAVGLNAWGPPDERTMQRSVVANPEQAPDPEVSVASWMRSAAGTPARPQQQPAPQPPAPEQPAPPVLGAPPHPAAAQPAPAPAPPGPQPAPQQAWGTEAAPPMTRRQMRESFLRTEQVEAPASTGVRGALARVGIRTQPSAAEREERDDVHAVSQHWPGVRTIAVVNGKGGAGKTPTTALLAATFARYSGAATIAWDNNETRGTLGWRTEQGKHENTVLDLIPRAGELLDPGARAGDISHYVHHQASDKYDVLRSNPHLLSAEQRIGADDVDAIHDVLGRYYRLIFVDSGNDESAGHWLRMIDKADQLVVPTIARPEHAEAGALLLEELVRRGGRSAELARRAVVVVSQAREKDAHPSAADIARGFADWVSAVVTIPYDRAMVESVLHFDALAPRTQRAWLRAAAAVARQL